MTDSTIIYTYTDEAPLLATYSFLPIVSAYASTAGVSVETRDISRRVGSSLTFPSTSSLSSGSAMRSLSWVP